MALKSADDQVVDEQIQDDEEVNLILILINVII